MLTGLYNVYEYYTYHIRTCTFIIFIIIIVVFFVVVLLENVPQTMVVFWYSRVLLYVVFLLF